MKSRKRERESQSQRHSAATAKVGTYLVVTSIPKPPPASETGYLLLSIPASLGSLFCSKLGPGIAISLCLFFFCLFLPTCTHHGFLRGVVDSWVVFLPPCYLASMPTVLVLSCVILSIRSPLPHLHESAIVPCGDLVDFDFDFFFFFLNLFSIPLFQFP